MDVVTEHHWTWVLEGADLQEKEWLANFLTFKDNQAAIAQASVKKQTGRTVNFQTHLYLLVPVNNPPYCARFPSGLLSTVVSTAAENGITINVTEPEGIPRTTYLPVNTPDPRISWLRGYQHDAVVKASIRKRGVLWLPTGAGKTEIAIGITRVMPGNWLFLVHRDTLREQTAERYKLRTGLTPQVWGKGQIDHTNVWREPFTVATFQSLKAGLHRSTPEVKQATEKLLEEADGLIIDECHVCPADSFWQITMKCAAQWRFGMSGTPLARGDRKAVYAVGALGPLIYRIRPEVLIQAGVLARPRIEFKKVPHEPGTYGRWATIYRHEIVQYTPRNQLIADTVSTADKPCLVFVSQLEHGKDLLKRIKAYGINAEFVFGEKPLDYRKAVVSRLERGDIDVLIASVIFQEGIDIPCLASVVMAAGGKSEIGVVQKIGRGLRVQPGKTTCTIHEFYDEGIEVLEKHTKARIKTYQREGYEVVIL